MLMGNMFWDWQTRPDKGSPQWENVSDSSEWLLRKEELLPATMPFYDNYFYRSDLYLQSARELLRARCKTVYTLLRS